MVGKQIIKQAQAITEIATQEQYDIAEVVGKQIAEEIKNTKIYFKPIKADAKKAWQNLVDAEKISLKDYEQVLVVLKALMINYEVEQERIRKAKEERLRKEAEDKILKEMETADEKGEEIKEPEYMPDDIIVQSSFEKKGQTRITYELEVPSIMDFLVYLVENKNINPYEYISIKTAPLKALAKNTKIPGVRLKEIKTKVF